MLHSVFVSKPPPDTPGLPTMQLDIRLKGEITNKLLISVRKGANEELCCETRVVQTSLLEATSILPAGFSMVQYAELHT